MSNLPRILNRTLKTNPLKHLKVRTVATQQKHEENVEKKTHFGFETVKESEKAEKGNVLKLVPYIF